jgi:uncharacterized repeat protein (TIGR01451 family)
LAGTIYSVTVTLNGVNHGFVSDLDVLLVGPGGQSVMLMSDCGGNAVISGATLTFDDLASLPLPSGGTINPGTYRPSNYDLADFIPGPAPPGPYDNLLSVFSGTNPNGAWSLYVVDDFSSDTGTLSGGWRLNITTLDPIADVAVTALTLPGAVAVGSNLVYNVSVNNLGPATASSVRLTNALPSGVTFVSASATQGSCALQPEGVVCELGTLAPSTTIVATVTVTPTVLGALTNSISVGASGLDLVPGNNSTRATTTARLTTDVLLAQAASTNIALVGQQVTYTLNLTNRGPNAATNVRLTDPVPANATFVSVANTAGSCSNVAGTVFCEFGSMAINGNARVTLVLEANASGSIANTATVVSDEIDANAANNSTTVITAVGLLADLGITTLPLADPVALGSPLTYTVTVTNLGPLSATSVVVTNGLPAGVNYVNASATQGTCNNAGGTVVCNLGNLANGAQATVSLTVIPTTVGGLTSSFGVSAGSVDLAPGNNLATSVTSVQAPPAITTPPQNQTVPLGSNVLFSVAATGNAPLAYQWLFNATNLPGATSPNLSLNNVTLASAGPYRVRVSNTVGSITSAVATLVVLSPPVISDVADQQTDEDTPTAALAVTVGDIDSPPAGLELTALSSNPTLVPGHQHCLWWQCQQSHRPDHTRSRSGRLHHRYLAPPGQRQLDRDRHVRAQRARSE